MSFTTLKERIGALKHSIAAGTLLGSVRNRLMLAVTAMLLLASIAAISVAVINGRHAVYAEATAALETTERHIRGLLQLTRDPSAIMDALRRETIYLRHVKLHVRAPNGDALEIESRHTLDDESTARPPQWFIELMAPPSKAFASRTILVPQTASAVIVSSNPEMEIAEKWTELSALAVVWLAVVCLLILGAYLVTGRILTPLVQLNGALTALEAGGRDERVPVPRLRELGDIARSFNSLACSLDQVRIENAGLYQQIISVQEDERRAIARELHDEAGPCLFGITTNVESIDRQTADIPAAAADRIRARSAEVLRIVKKLKHMNRALLKSLSPMAAGKIPLGALLEELVKDFEQRHPDVRVIRNYDSIVRSYGERVDVTVYRCVQEAMTNAVRHGEASCIEIMLAESPGRNSSAQQLRLSIRDNGRGMTEAVKPGFGLAAMRERVLSVGGRWIVCNNWPSGTIIDVEIPFDAATVPTSTFLQSDSEKLHDISARH